MLEEKLSWNGSEELGQAVIDYFRQMGLSSRLYRRHAVKELFAQGILVSDAPGTQMSENDAVECRVSDKAVDFAVLQRAEFRPYQPLKTWRVRRADFTQYYPEFVRNFANKLFTTKDLKQYFREKNIRFPNINGLLNTLYLHGVLKKIRTDEFTYHAVSEKAVKDLESFAAASQPTAEAAHG